MMMMLVGETDKHMVARNKGLTDEMKRNKTKFEIIVNYTAKAKKC